jgi:hypothetical protein
VSRLKRRQEAELVLACAPIEDRLADAKQGHTDAPTDETRAERRAAMATLHETRAWLRATDELRRLPQEIAALQESLTMAELARDKKKAERVAELEGKLAAAAQRQARIRAQFGGLVEAMDELAGGA